MPFIYEVHEELVPGWERLGWTILGIVALVWMIDCFVGLYLTFPIRRASTQTFSILKWCRRWSPARAPRFAGHVAVIEPKPAFGNTGQAASPRS
jgi:uncharacterized iron-regulated membrane protein